MKITRYPLKPTSLQTGRDASLSLRMNPLTPTAEDGSTAPPAVMPHIIINGVDAGQIPATATEVYADWSGDLLPIAGVCGVLITTDGVPAGSEFVVGEVPIDPTEIEILIQGDTSVNAPRCTQDFRVVLECREGVPTIVIYDGDTELGTRDMSSFECGE